ncbi:MAG: diguanylate cyclase [Polyangiaceae bacterium]
MGLFWKKAVADETRVSGEGRVAPETQVDAGGELDSAVETIAEMLRAFGASSLSQEVAASCAAACEQWAQHLLVFAVAPGAKEPTKEREWRSLRRAFAKLRKDEISSANQQAATMRDALWAFIRAFSRVLSADGTADTQLASQLTRLREAVAAPESDDLRREVMSAVEAIEVAVREKQTRLITESSEIAARVQSLSDQLEVAKREGATDPLTKVANRKAFDEQLEGVHELAALGAPATLLMVDLDFFKKVNDELGHQAGDKVLRAVADSLVRTCRRRRDFVARYGGEEFAIVLPETSLQEGKALAERACAAVRALKIIDKSLTVSIGIATVARGESREDWIARADRALYSAKGEGRDRAVLG